MINIIYDGKELKLSDYLQNRFNLSFSMQCKYLKENKIKVNSKKVPLTYKLQKNDQIKLYILGLDENAPKFMFAKDELDIVYEDENILILNKPQKLECIDENNINCDTLINRVLKYLKYSDGFVPSLCHRLDLNTSGIVLVAKNEESKLILDDIIKKHTLFKEYTAITTSIPDDKNYIKSYLKKDANASFVKNYTKPQEGAKEAILEYKKVAVNKNFALVKINLKTGRTHQIRVQFASINCSILGDTKYGNVTINNKTNIKRQVLSATRIIFPSLSGKLEYLSNKEFSVDSSKIEELFKSL